MRLCSISAARDRHVGGLGVALVALALDRVLPWYLLFPLAIAGAALFGAAWAFLPAWLQARFGSHIVITTIMFNFIAASLMVWLLIGPLKPPGSQQPETRTFEEGASLPHLDGLFAFFGADLGAAPSTHLSWRLPRRYSSTQFLAPPARLRIRPSAHRRRHLAGISSAHTYAC